MREIILVAHNIRSCHNVGSLLRTAEGLGIKKVWLTGYTPYPIIKNDTRLPHIARKLDTQIHKTALGAEKSVAWQQSETIEPVLKDLQKQEFQVAALEQASHSVMLPSFKPSHKLALIVGREVEGLEPEILETCDIVLEIPMAGRKESFNVVQAAAMALYHARYA